MSEFHVGSKFHVDTMSNSQVIRSKKVKIYR